MSPQGWHTPSADATEAISELAAAVESMIATDRVLRDYTQTVADDVLKLWEAVAELRDDLHAVVNRVESVTRTATETAQYHDELQRLRELRNEGNGA